MSNIVKWGILTAGLIAIVAVCSTFGLLDGVTSIGGLINQLVSLLGSGLQFGRGLINNFLTPSGRVLLTGLLMFIFFKWVVTMGVKITTTVYHFIFRG